MNPISPFSTTLISILALLITLSGVVAAESDSVFLINGKPVPNIVANVNGTKLTSDLLKREMIAYRLLESRQGETMEATDEEKVALDKSAQDVKKTCDAIDTILAESN